MLGEIVAIVGAGTYVYALVDVALPPAVVTTTSTTPAAWAGVVTVTAVAVLFVIVAGVPPNVTLVAPERAVPLMMTLWLPAAGPADGATVVNDGAFTYVNALIEVAEPPVVVTTTST